MITFFSSQNLYHVITTWSQDSPDVLKHIKTCAGINSSEKSLHESIKQQSTGSTYHEKPL